MTDWRMGVQSDMRRISDRLPGLIVVHNNQMRRVARIGPWVPRDIAQTVVDMAAVAASGRSGRSPKVRRHKARCRWAQAVAVRAAHEGDGGPSGHPLMHVPAVEG
jgi:hypothetical protein